MGTPEGARVPRAPRLLRLSLASVVSLATAVSAGAWTSEARAQTADAATAAAAERLFEEGRSLMAAKRFEEACPRLAESLRLDPATGTLLNLAECYEQVGKMASAWATYKWAAASAKRDGHASRMKYANAGVERTSQKLAFLTVDVDSPADGLVVTRDEDKVGAGSFGVSVPVDPGVHVVTAKAPGRVEWKTEAKVGGQERVRVRIPALAAAPEAPTAAGAATKPPPPSPAAGRDDGDGSSAGSTQRWIGWTATGIGVVGLGVGLAFGLDAKSKNDQARADHCTPVSCTSRGDAMIDEADRSAQIATGLVIGGAAAAAVGIILVLTAPRGTTVRATARGPVLELGGTF